jgi:hypothetical protein
VSLDWYVTVTADRHVTRSSFEVVLLFFEVVLLDCDTKMFVRNIDMPHYFQFYVYMQAIELDSADATLHAF